MGTHAAVEPVPAPSGEGTVVLDIGGTRGAAVVYTPASLVGAEIEIRRAGRPWDGTHTAVRRRDLRDTAAYAGVFGSLEAGAYQAAGCGGSPAAGGTPRWSTSTSPAARSPSWSGPDSRCGRRHRCSTPARGRPRAAPGPPSPGAVSD